MRVQTREERETEKERDIRDMRDIGDKRLRRKETYEIRDCEGKRHMR